MDDFKKTVKMQCFKDGGSVQTQVSNYTKRSRKVTDAADIAQDKAVVKKAFAIHDKQEHPGEKTDLSTLKKGGRAKKAVGTVRKYKTGGSVDNVYGAKKKAGDLDNIQKTKDIKATKLCGGGKAVKKMAGGGLTGLDAAAMQNALPGGIGQGSANDMERRRMMERAKNAMKYLGPAQQSQFVNQGGMSPTGVAQPPAPAQAAPAGSTIPAGQKRGGKVKKMNTGGTAS